MLRYCYGHNVLDGEKFFAEKYLRKGRSVPEKKDVYRVPGEIFEVFVGIYDDLAMNDDEYGQLVLHSNI